MSEWKPSRLRDVGVSLIDCVHKTPEAQPTGYPYVGIPQMKNGRIDFSTARLISREDFLEWTKKAKPQKYDVILSRRTNPGVTAIDDTGTDFALGQNLVILRADGTRVYPPFLKWMTQSPYWWEQIAKYNNVGAVFDSLKCADVPIFELPVPPLEIQKPIATLLGMLDEKIELNRRMNGTLEAMARAIFKDWFVDFGPTRAKMEGRTPYLAPDIWSLFPECLDPAGNPEAWKRSSIYEVSEVIYGAPFSSKLFNTGHIGRPLIRIRDLAGEVPAIWTTEVHPKGYMVTQGDIVVGMDGEFRAHLWGGDDAWLNQRVCVFVPKKGVSRAFVRNSIAAPLAHIEATEIATTVIHLGKNDIDRFEVVLPDGKVLDEFNRLCQPMYDRIVANKVAARILGATRDLLLPKLMSGEVRIGDAEKLLSEVL